MIKELNSHYSFTNPATVHDEEALTALELAGRTTAKVNEVVRAQNTLAEQTLEHLENQDADIQNQKDVVIPATIKTEVQKHIDNGDFDDAIDEYAGGLESRLNALLGTVKEGSTTMDAEIIDARGSYTALGNRLSTTMENKNKEVTASNDANTLTSTGFYVVSSAHEWLNLPDGNSKAGLLEVYKREGTSVNSCYQFFTDYLSHNRYVRYLSGETFTEWETDYALRNTPINSTNFDEVTTTGLYFVGSSANYENMPPNTQAGVLMVMDGGGSYNKYQLFINYNGGDMWERNLINPDKGFSEWRLTDSWGNRFVLSACDINTVNTDGYYWLGGTIEYTNLPNDEKAGILHVFCSKESYKTRFFQIFYAYSGSVYIRNYRADLDDFNAWKRLLTVNDVIVTPSSSGDSKEYTLVKESDTSVFIYKKGSRGFIRYQYMRQVNDSINLDVWRLATVSLCDTTKTLLKEISQVGADLEGVVLLDGESDHVGGVHGDEQMTGYHLFIDGKPYTFDNVENMECDEIRIIVDSTITHQDTTNVCMNKNKQTTFNKDGVHVRSTWEALEELSITSIRGCMMSVQKDCITHYYDSNVNLTPLEVPAVSESSVKLSQDVNMTDVFYMGDMSIHHWAGERGGQEGGYSTILQDYGARLKSYFNCYDGHTASVGEKLVAENHFNITC